MPKPDYQKMWAELHKRLTKKQKEAMTAADKAEGEAKLYHDGMTRAFAGVRSMMYDIEKMNS